VKRRRFALLAAFLSLCPFRVLFFYECIKINLTPCTNTNFPIYLLLSLISDTHHLFIKATFAWMRYLALESLNRLCSLLHSCPGAFHKLIKNLLVPVDFSDAPHYWVRSTLRDIFTMCRFILFVSRPSCPFTFAYMSTVNACPF